MKREVVGFFFLSFFLFKRQIGKLFFRCQFCGAPHHLAMLGFGLRGTRLCVEMYEKWWDGVEGERESRKKERERERERVRERKREKSRRNSSSRDL